MFSWGMALLVVVFMFDASPFGISEHILGSGFDIAAAGLGVVLVSIIAWWAFQQRRFDLFELPIWFSLNAYGQIVLNVWLLQRDISLGSPWLFYDAGVMMVLAIGLIGVSLTAMWAGYIWFTRKLECYPVKDQPLVRTPRLKIIIFVWFVTWLLETQAILTSLVGYLPGTTGFVWGNYLAFINLVNNLCTFILLFYHFRHSNTVSWVWVLFVCSSEIVLGFIVGTKSAVFIFLYIAMVISYTKRKTSKNWLMIGLLLLMLTVPIVNTFRANLFALGFDRSAGAGLMDRLSILGTSIQETLTQPSSHFTEQTLNTFAARQGVMLEITAAIMKAHPKTLPFLGIDMLSSIAESSIPRILWPEKPVGRPELYLITTTYLGASGEYSFASPGLFADAYRTGGWLFVMLWFWLLGVFAAWLYWQGPRRNDLAGTAFYLIMLTNILIYNSNIFRLILNFAQYATPIWIGIMYIAFRSAPLNNSSSATLQNSTQP